MMKCILRDGRSVSNWPTIRKLTMTFTRRQLLHAAAAAATVPGFSRSARSQTYPTRPVTMIVPFPAGGPTDVIGRIVADGMQASLGQPIIIENVGGAAGSVATGKVARSPSDGYTIGLGAG